MSISFSDFVLYFMLYSVLGWICEVVFCSIPAKKLVNRGFLAGPYCPIYGFGALIILFLLQPFLENPPLLFLFAVISTTLLEYVASWALEALFGIRWWDYSNRKLNVNGRIYVLNSLIFGVLGVLVAYTVHPMVSQLVMGIDGEYKRVIASLLIAAVAVDLVTTLNAIYKLDERIKNHRDLQGKVPGRRLIAAFPNMKHPAIEERVSAFVAGFKDRSERIHEVFWTFFIASVIGFVLETIFCFVTLGYIESRQGVIYGPFSPIYGVGAVIMAEFFKRNEKSKDMLIFAGCGMIGGAFEFLCSFLQELAFGTVSWDYTQEAYSIGGRTSLLYMFFWGILGLILVKTVYPAISRFVQRMPNRKNTSITWVLVCFMSINVTVSAAAVARWSERVDGVAPQNTVEEYLDQRYPNSLLEEVYPNMKKVQ